jgi:hypothetical protein
MRTKVPQPAPNRVFVVGVNFPKESQRVWEFVGVFTTKEKAVAACTSPNHFVGPVLLNKRAPEETVSWPDSWYPKLEGEV